jgi:hypothetical protein
VEDQKDRSQGDAGAEQDELHRQREQGERDQEEGEDGTAPNGDDGAEIERAQPEEQAEEETTEDIDRAFD